MTYSIDEIIRKIYGRYSKQGWTAAAGALIIGAVTHLFILSNELFNHDDLGSFFKAETGVRPLRWLQSVFVNFVSPWGSPVLTGSLTIILIAVSALLVADTFEIQSHALAVLIGGIMASSPIVASFMSYVEGSYLFVIGLPFAILAVRWYEKGIHGYLLAIVFIMLATAGYQSLFAVVIAGMYIQLFGRLLHENWSLKEWIIGAVKAVSALLLGLVTYILSTKVATLFVFGNTDQALNLGVTKTELQVQGYEAQAESGTVYLSNILNTVKGAAKQFIHYHFNTLFDGANQSPVSRYCVAANIILLLGLCAITAVYVIRVHGIWHKILLIVSFLAAPICLNSTEILLNGKATASMQMMYSLVFTAVFVVGIVQSTIGERFKNLMGNIAFIVLAINIYTNMQITNDAYMRMYTIYETAYSEMTRILDRVEQLPEWQQGTRKLYFDFAEDSGYLINENYQSFTWMDNYIDMGWCGVMGTGVYRFYNSENTAKFVEAYFGIKFETPAASEIEKLKMSPEYQKMEMFPSIDSVKVIDGVVVVRMDDSVG